MQTSVSASLASHPPFAGISFEVGQPDSPVQRRSAHERLRACIGDWRASGKLDAGGEMRCLESYSWLPAESLSSIASIAILATASTRE